MPARDGALAVLGLIARLVFWNLAAYALEVTMSDSTRDDRREQIEMDIRIALETVRAARIAWARSPNPNTIEREQDAEAELNDLLDIHHKLYAPRQLVSQ